MTTPSKKQDPAARVTFPLPANNRPNQIAATCVQQATTVLASSDISNHPEVADAANKVKAQAGVVTGLVSDIGTAEANLTSLRSKRTDGVLLLRLLHGNMESLVNVAANGDKTKATGYGGKVVTRTTYAVTDDPPTNPGIKARGGGNVEARCKAEKAVICYLFQTGSDPAHPEAWPLPVFSGGCTHTFAGLLPGQKAYVRIAVVRTGSVQGKWSDVLEVMVS